MSHADLLGLSPGLLREAASSHDEARQVRLPGQVHRQVIAEVKV